MATLLEKIIISITKPKIDLSTLTELDAASAELDLKRTEFFRGKSESEKNDFLYRMAEEDKMQRIRVYLERFTGKLCYVENRKLYWIR